MIIVGIDNGLSGALAAISSTPGTPIIGMRTMPTQQLHKGREIDIRGVNDWLNIVTDHNKRQCTIVIEIPGKHTPGFQALCSMWEAFGRLCAWVELKGLRHHRVQPRAWQKVMLPGCEKGMTKPAALAVARRLWPEENWRATGRCSTPHTGLIDAILIAEYARRGAL